MVIGDSTRHWSISGRRGLRLRYKWPHFDRAFLRCRNSRCDGQRFVQIAGVDQEETAELLLGFGERAVSGQPFAIANPYRGCGGCRLELAAPDVLAFFLQVFSQRAVLQVDGLGFGLVLFGLFGLVVINQQQILHDLASCRLVERPALGSTSHLTFFSGVAKAGTETWQGLPQLVIIFQICCRTDYSPIGTLDGMNAG
jgi:hypothetical protein